MRNKVEFRSESMDLMKSRRKVDTLGRGEACLDQKMQAGTSRSKYSGVSRFTAFYPRVEKVLERWASGNYFGF